MAEELDPKFTRCFIKKSKYYFKQEMLVVGAIILAGIAFALLIVGLDWISTVINLEKIIIYVFIAIDIIIVGIITLVSINDTRSFLTTFIKTFIKIHVAFAILLCLLAIEFTCFFGAPILAMAIAWIVCVEVLGFGFIGGLIGVAIAGVILLPLNYSAFICLKIDPYVDTLWKKVIAWL